MKILANIVAGLLLLGGTALGMAEDMEGHGHSAEEHSMQHETPAGEMPSSHGTVPGFNHSQVVDGVRAEFTVMSLASMKIPGQGDETHHVMVKFFDEAAKTQVIGLAAKVKIVSPSGKESEAGLKDYSGIYAANFSAKEPGKYGIICLFRIADKNRVVKFWYPMAP